MATAIATAYLASSVDIRHVDDAEPRLQELGVLAVFRPPPVLEAMLEAPIGSTRSRGPRYAHQPRAVL